MLNITLKRPLVTLAVTAGLLAAAAGPASASPTGPLITPPHTETTAPASFELVIDGVDIGWVSPTPASSASKSATVAGASVAAASTVQVQGDVLSVSQAPDEQTNVGATAAQNYSTGIFG